MYGQKESLGQLSGGRKEAFLSSKTPAAIHGGWGEDLVVVKIDSRCLSTPDNKDPERPVGAAGHDVHSL